MTKLGLDSLGTKKKIICDQTAYNYFSLQEAQKHFSGLERLPYSLKILLENILRFENGRTIRIDDIKAFHMWLQNKTSTDEIAFQPARVLMQDFTGVPAIVDLAAMREAFKEFGGNPQKINPLVPVDLVIDHSVMVDSYAKKSAFQENVSLEYHRNKERYSFLRWGQQAFNNFRVVPPGTGICHQVNLEYLAQVVWSDRIEGEWYAYPDTLVGTDSHTTMVNGLSVLGWGVGGIEAEAAMLGQPISMRIPDVLGFKLTGNLPEGATATDLVLTITHLLRLKGVVGKFVEFYGEGLRGLSLADRATIANMAPEYGATCGFFPIDQETLNYLAFTGRTAERVGLVEMYAKEQGLWHDHSYDPVYSEIMELDLQSIESTLAGPKRPQDKLALSSVKKSFENALQMENKEAAHASVDLENDHIDLEDGHVVIAAITSCTNTSNPSVMLGAALLAQKALEKGLKVKPWVKTSLAPGSQVVSDYLEKAGLQKVFEELGFYLVGYGCTTCIGNSGPLRPELAQAIDKNDLTVASVLSGNRNFEGRIHPQVKLSYLASPLLVVAYALAGTVNINLVDDPLGIGADGKPVYLKEIWPSHEEISTAVRTYLTPEMFRERYAKVFEGDQAWQTLGGEASLTYAWEKDSTYVKQPPFFENLSDVSAPLQAIKSARLLAILGDSITTDHISPAGSIKIESPAGQYLISKGIKPEDFNSYGARRGNHEVMMRGTFANIRLKNEMVPMITGGMTRHVPSGEVMSIYDAAMRYQEEETPLIIMAGREYGSGSSRDWAAKGTRLLGVKAIIAESFERIHRSNLIGMGVLPLEFMKGVTRKTLNLKGDEIFDLQGFEQELTPGMSVNGILYRENGEKESLHLKCRIDTLDEVEYFKQGGILHYVLRQLRKK
ncbi:MAG: aconitate hydratase AcnA [Candidatus Paracaedimonas acanthamoebae]|uniref:Aconitate hydratase n=1 Tax=Candidatus Paracaedimonas acanthamoebae TaxID=244581 RepID=A0A8J7Q137_9PROT|nr:aconitate hydratase AcnA [Candidatus Paracaedimonas acanthamoebae]